ncbi:hypothetical protein L6272_02140 [Microgenomates group bacterium]|nr:hypothetical protein [Microgenomates group bacterium]
MPTSISLTYPITYFQPSASLARNLSASWRIFRRTLQLVHSRSFQVSAEAVAVLSIFTAVAVWAF